MPKALIFCAVLLSISLGCSKSHKDAVNALNRGIEAHRSGQHDLAINWLDKAIAHDADFAEAHYTKGFVLALGKKNCKSAMGSFRAATDLDSGHAEAWYQLGKCYQASDAEDEALGAFKKTVKANRRHAAALYELGRISVDRGALAQADAYLRKSIVANHRSPHAFLALGRLYAQAGYLDSAEKVLREGLRLTGAHPMLENEMGVVLLDGGRHLEAIEHLERAVGSRVGIADFNLAVALLRKGDLSQGRRYLSGFLRDNSPETIDEDVLKLAQAVLDRIPR